MKEKEALDLVRKKTDRLMERIDPSQPKEPRGHTEKGRYTDRFETFFQPGWTYSFFTGMVMLMYHYTGEERYLDWLKRAAKPYTDFLFVNEAEIGHDTGFLYSLYAVPMYRATGDPLYRTLALKAADEVGKRYRFASRHIQSFFDLRIRGKQDEISMMIVDDMMNMNLLMWAYKETGHSFYRDVFSGHIETAIKALIRDDFSVRHAYHFDAVTGSMLGEMNYCGYGIGTHWARGTSWMIHGLTRALAQTGEQERYRYMLEGVLQRYLDRTEGDGIPLWDFDDPSERVNRDTSAAAIVACAIGGFGELSLHEGLKSRSMAYADRVAETLCADWMAPEEAEHLIDYGDGEGTSWGDYFFTELLVRRAMGEDAPTMWV